MNELGESAVEFLRSREALVPLGIILAGFVDGIIVVGFFVNGALLFAVAVYFLANGAVSFPELVLYALVGACLGDHAGYWIGKLVGERPFSWWPLRRRPELKDKMVRWLERYGALGLVAGRFFSPTRSVAPFLAAVLGMKYRSFAYGDLVACALWVSVWSVVVFLVVQGYWSVTLE